MTTADLVSAEAYYLSTLKRVGSALNLASNQTLSSGRKASNTVRALVERWTILMRIHIKFHDDLVAVRDDTRSAVKLLSAHLLALEPILVDHGRDLASVVYKLSRNDKKSGRTPVEWDIALRPPFDHLAVYNEWLQCIDPRSMANQEGLSQLNMVVRHVKTVIETNQSSRGMLKRMSTFARGVIKRPPSHPQLASSQTSVSSSSTTTPRTTIIQVKNDNGRGASIDLNRVVRSTEIKNAFKSSTETVTTVSMSCSYVDITGEEEEEPSALDGTSNNREGGGGDGGESASSSVAQSRHHLKRRSLARSDMSSSVGSLTLAPSSESLNAKARSFAIATAAGTNNVHCRPNGVVCQVSTASQRQKYLEERESRKATLKMGAQAFIAAKAESLQSPNFVSRPSIDRLRTITKRETDTKPPVKSLINFWEQAVEPIEV
ncbi:hypothetical protein BGX28_007609 [Mortierella sp. GBA30]|nr:hypothetical protein BGX28_007609 [Mortierella sp. GBA30]